MKHLPLAICFMFLTSPLCGNIDSLYRSAVALYEEGDYESALATFRTIVGSGHEAADLYYNMGNAAFRSNNVGYAILYYEKALKMDPSHSDAAHNLEFASQYRVDVFEEVPVLFIRTWISSAVNALSEPTWSILSLSGFILVLASILVYLFAKGLNLKKAGFFSALFGIVFFLFAFSATISKHRSITQPPGGIIISPSVLVRSTPNDSGTELFVLHEGSKVTVSEEVTGWYNIRIVDGREGWIRGDDFEHI
jgi:hypothetical protein